MTSPLFRSLTCTVAVFGGVAALFGQARTASQPRPPNGVIRTLPGALEGFTVVAPLRSTSTFLIDMRGAIVHEWQSRVTPTFGVHVLANGNLLRAGHDPHNLHFQVGGKGGVIQEIAWDGSVVWEFVYSNRQHVQHHDIEPLPNGNVLLLAWERKTAHEALMAGRDPKLLTGVGLWPECLIEVRPTRPSGGEIVWEWHLWDHLIQDRDPRLRNHGTVSEHPELIDINGDSRHLRESDQELARLRALGYIVDAPHQGGPPGFDPNRNHDWNHANAISYNPELDQIVVSVLRFSELWVIDHSTTTEEAAGDRGGKGGRGGNLLYRWGNPQTYRGTGYEELQTLFSQHDVRWIPQGLPGAGNLTVFNNGRGRSPVEYSSVDEIRLPRNERGGYRTNADGLPAPAEVVWTFSGSDETRFYSGHISGAERLPNGNTLICDGEQGRIFEVSPDGEIVWDYLNPIAGEVVSQAPPWVPTASDQASAEIDRYGLLRASRVPVGHPGLSRLKASGKR